MPHSEIPARGRELEKILERPARHPRAIRPNTLVFTILLSVGGSIIGLQVLTTLGITPYTALIGVLFAIALSRIPIPALREFRSIHVQNLAQSSISAATYGAANSLLVPIGVPVLIDRPDLLWPMLAGATLAMLIDLSMLYWVFDSRLFPGSAAWPPGVAAAESIIAGDQGGHSGRLLLAGAAAGVLGSSVGLPMAALGTAFIGNIWALSMLGAGLLVRAYSPSLLHVDINKLFVPHGLMIGAGLVALMQAVLLILPGRRRGPAPVNPNGFTRSEGFVRRVLVVGFGLYVAGAILLAGLSGLWVQMPLVRLAGWVLFAAVSCITAELIAGFSAMHAGWFAAFATALIFLLLGMIAGFPPAATALLVGFVAAGGPAFADGGYDLKAGWYLRGWGRDPNFDLEGRREQIISAAVGMLTSLFVVVLAHNSYFSRGLFPPIDRVYAATIRSVIDPSMARTLFAWAIPGAALQIVGGARRQLGILFATGLLLFNPAAGWLLLTGLLLRAACIRIAGQNSETAMSIFGAGCIAGGALADFANSVVTSHVKTSPGNR
jgi:uncharacterized oligopeptide transporter (OPT) family protein